MKIAIKPLIKAACQMAILKMRTSVLGVRTGVVRSHALNLDTMQRISRCSPRVLPFSRPTTVEDDKEPTPDVEIDEEEVRAWPWMQELRKQVRADGYDKPGLQELKRSGDFCGKTLAGYALYLIGRKRFEESTVHKYVFLIANRLMLKVAGQDEERASRTWQSLLEDQIAWDDLIEQVLDDDAYYHRRRYSRSIDREAAVGQGEGEAIMVDKESGGNAAESPVAIAVDSSAATPESQSAERDRDAAGYSRALLKALGNFVAYLNRGKQASEELTTKLPPVGMIRVDATMITVDEFRQALDWFEGPNVNQSQVHLRKTARVALILAFRCGLSTASFGVQRETSSRFRLHRWTVRTGFRCMADISTAHFAPASPRTGSTCPNPCASTSRNGSQSSLS